MFIAFAFAAAILFPVAFALIAVISYNMDAQLIASIPTTQEGGLGAVFNLTPLTRQAHDSTVIDLECAALISGNFADRMAAEGARRDFNATWTNA